MRFGICALLAALVWGAGVAGGAPAPGFELQDQFGKRHRVAFPRERVSVLAFADREGSGQLEAWVRPLYERYRDAIDIHGVARLAGVPVLLRPLVRSLFRRSLRYPVMMDWTGNVSTGFDYESRVANVVVVGPDGQVEYRFNGRADPAELQACFARIDGLLAARAPRAE